MRNIFLKYLRTYYLIIVYGAGKRWETAGWGSQTNGVQFA